MSRPQAVILDVDGTLIGSNDAHARAYEDAGRELGYEIPFAQVRPLIGKGGDKVLPEVTGIEEDSEEGQRITERKGDIFEKRYLPTLQPTPGARALLERLRDEGIPMVIATSAKRDALKGLLKQANVDDLVEMEDATSASDAKESKPDPDIVQAALEKTGCPADHVVMLGDTPYDVEAATRAGIAVVAVRCGGWNDDDLAGAVAVYDDPADLLRNLEQSPLARRG